MSAQKNARQREKFQSEGKQKSDLRKKGEVLIEPMHLMGWS